MVWFFWLLGGFSVIGAVGGLAYLVSVHDDYGRYRESSETSAKMWALSFSLLLFGVFSGISACLVATGAF
jgi:hypothetical protein